eukprot:scaffold13914_cov77-Skeletonema_marinoi.AAC.2
MEGKAMAMVLATKQQQDHGCWPAVDVFVPKIGAANDFLLFSATRAHDIFHLIVTRTSSWTIGGDNISHSNITTTEAFTYLALIIQ